MFDRNVVQDLEYRKELAERFNAEQEGIQVTVDVIPQGYDQTIMARIAGGTAGDAFRHASHFGMSKFTTRGCCRNWTSSWPWTTTTCPSSSKGRSVPTG